jgi:prevent-host-death family protein
MRNVRRSTPSEAHSIRRDTRGAPARFTATQAKNEFGRVLEMALHGDAVVITKHDAPKAILISVDQFNRLTHATESTLDTLSLEFDALLAGMQSPKSSAAMKAAFAASPAELGKAAVIAARRRG